MSKTALKPEIVEEAGNSGPPIERHCKECGNFIEGEPVQEGGHWILGPCQQRVKGRRFCGGYNVYQPETRRTTSRGHLWLEEEKKKQARCQALAPYLDGREYNRGTFVDETRFYLTQSLQGAVEAGRRLIVIREHEERGDFVNLLENELGIPTTSAYRLIKLAQCVQEFPTVGKMKKLTTAYHLTELSEDDLKEMEATGLLDGKSTDEIDKMTSKELRDLVRKQRGQLVKGEEQLKKARSALESARKGKSSELTDLDRLCAQTLKTLGTLSLLEIDDEEREAAEGYFGSITDAMDAVRVNLLNTGAVK